MASLSAEQDAALNLLREQEIGVQNFSQAPAETGRSTSSSHVHDNLAAYELDLQRFSYSPGREAGLTRPV
jgi:hypothetical protein